MKTAEEIAEATLDAHAIKPRWRRDGEQIAALIAEAIEADRAQRPTPDTHCFREDSPTVRCSLCGWLAAAHTGCDCEVEEED